MGKKRIFEELEFEGEEESRKESRTPELKKPKRKIIDFEEGWGILQKGILKLEKMVQQKSQGRKRFSADEYMQLYSTVHTMCIYQKPPHHYQDKLYYKYKESVQNYVASWVLPALREKQSQGDEFMMREFLNQWEIHKTFVVKLSHIFQAVDDSRFVMVQSLPSLNAVGKECFCHLVYLELRINIREALIRLMKQQPDQIGGGFVKAMGELFLELGIDYYDNDFVPAVLEGRVCYYSTVGATWMEFPREFMMRAEECLSTEIEIVARYLYSDFGNILREKVAIQLVGQYGSRILCDSNIGCRALLRDYKVDDLSRMYKLFSYVPNGLEPVAQIFRDHIVGEGRSLFECGDQEMEDAQEELDQDEKKVGALVRKVMEFHDKHLQCLCQCFMNDSLFCIQLKGAFEELCNKQIAGRTSGEALATFCNTLLKNRSMSDEDVENGLVQVMGLFSYIDDKDMFGRFYMGKLAGRILSAEGINFRHESSMLSKLKQHCGEKFTNKMEQMLADLTSSKDIHLKFEEYLAAYPDADLGTNMTLKVLTSEHWPNLTSFNGLKLPSGMDRCIKVFEEFYQNTEKNRKLTWVHSLGICNIKVGFDPGQKELIVTPCQASALLLFNSSERLSFFEIKSQLNLTDEEVVVLLESLACAEYKILIKDPKTTVVAQTDSFEFNSKFTHELDSIRIPFPQVSVSKLEEKLMGDGPKDRCGAIDALIMRIMKNQRTVSHENLVIECNNQLKQKFKPGIKEIKGQIEDLMKREFLERDEDDPTIYRYIE